VSRRVHRKRRDTVRACIEKALRELRKQNADITISSVSRRAGVTRKSDRREDLVALIRAHRPVAAVPDDSPLPADTETSIVAALRARLTAKDTQIAQLKAALRERDRTIAALHGELEKRGGRAEKTVTLRCRLRGRGNIYLLP
jgi:capsule polysaccharide export protein KpsE/RkpR